MPLPKPHDNETEQDYVHRCVHVVMHDGTTNDNKQAVAMCFSNFARAHNKEHMASMTAAASSSTITRRQLHGREHIIIPTIALRGGINIAPHGGDPLGEYVPDTVIEHAAHTWNGRPVVWDHPYDLLTGAPISALSPDTAERHTIGTVYNSRFSDGKLHAELWLDSSLLDKTPAAR